MNEPFYDFTVLDEAHRYDFLSIGRTAIHKAIVYSSTSIPNLYSLMLADVEPNGELNVYSISNNGDMRHILATVYQTIVHFFDLHPNATIAFTGSSSSRVRLYRSGISIYINQLRENFQVFGIRSDASKPETFQPGNDYTYFVICLKNHNFDLHLHT
ncbi:hypothetical protein LXM25_27670 [Dyadobacter sp. LJ53]|uniref:DUF6934 family protein n=1 Tax=Dyadobacter chenwenxiniae TaxID=2906456 RepID=UPI001F41F5BF|nr:hypothetical protein [Dyadobacter chenwenxiniae]MCF0053884.1 hypothetical protein [Dyadobacter chenwenxiniae]